MTRKTGLQAIVRIAVVFTIAVLISSLMVSAVSAEQTNTKPREGTSDVAPRPIEEERDGAPDTEVYLLGEVPGANVMNGPIDIWIFGEVPVTSEKGEPSTEVFILGEVPGANSDRVERTPIEADGDSTEAASPDRLAAVDADGDGNFCLLYTSPSPRDRS